MFYPQSQCENWDRRNDADCFVTELCAKTVPCPAGGIEHSRLLESCSLACVQAEDADGYDGDYL